MTLYDKWLYVLKNLSYLDKRPAALKEKIYTKLFKEAEIAKFTLNEQREYEDCLKAYRDIKNSLDTALEQGIEQGRAEGIEEGIEEGMQKGRAKERTEIATAMLLRGMDMKTVAELTGITEEELKTCSPDSTTLG